MTGYSLERFPLGGLAVSLVVVTGLACTPAEESRTALCTLVDASGTYTEQMPAVTKIIRTAILPHLVPGDSLFLIGIDSDSYDEENLWAKLTLDLRPSRANAQKLEFAESLSKRLDNVPSAPLTDISGAMMLCGDYLKGAGAGSELMLVLSDMQEELAAGVVRDFGAEELTGVKVVALNVIKLAADNAQPASYRQRLESWESRLLAAGARSFEVVADAGNLPAVLEGRRGAP